MILKTIVPYGTPDAVKLDYYMVKENEDSKYYKEISIYGIDKEYSDEEIAGFAKEMSKYYIHAKSVDDYESSSDAGNGMDDYSSNKYEIEPSIENCIIENGKLVAFMCEKYGMRGVLLFERGYVTITETSYSGRNYHHYVYTCFELREKE